MKISDKLRSLATTYPIPERAEPTLLREAADEIERLEAKVDDLESSLDAAGEMLLGDDR